MIPSKHQAQWEADCMKYRGRILTGKYSHWCFDWDGLPIDETTLNEWPCGCYDIDEVETLDELISSGN